MKILRFHTDEGRDNNSLKDQYQLNHHFNALFKYQKIHPNFKFLTRISNTKVFKISYF